MLNGGAATASDVSNSHTESSSTRTFLEVVVISQSGRTRLDKKESAGVP